jgi:cyclopropane fatty-acyl-phospholipid synthase-like methyltransferase
MSKHSSELPGDEDEVCKSSKHSRTRKKFGMEYRPTLEHWAKHYEQRKDSIWKILGMWKHGRVWETYWGWYETAKQRDQAMENFAKKCFYNEPYPEYEYRPVER